MHFKESELIEKWGSGLRRIYDECKGAKVPMEFVVLKSGFLVIFRRKPEWAERKDEGLNSLLVAIKDNAGIKAKNLSSVLDNRPLKTIERQIKILINKKLIERKGSRKTGGYYCIKKPPTHTNPRQCLRNHQRRVYRE
jgi:ATP-dependent DNA helicase RecG